jgi:hypothetical protein
LNENSLTTFEDMTRVQFVLSWRLLVGDFAVKAG